MCPLIECMMEYIEYWLHEKENPQRVVEEQLEVIKEVSAKLRSDFGKTKILQFCKCSEKQIYKPNRGTVWILLPLWNEQVVI